MPRSTRESDDDAEHKTGRMQIQKLNIPSTVNSPFLRRSSRIKSKYSPNSSESDTGSISSSQPTKNTRGRTATMDNIVSETLKGGRTRKASISSDISESTDIDILGTPKKRTTRSSLAATSIDTPTKINTRAASKRLIRAGSETKSPAVRTTRRTRASSVDPESLSQQNRSHPGTPIRKRVSLLMPESPVKEDEKKNLIPYVRLDTTIVEVEEFINSGNSDSSPDKTLRSQQSQRINKKRPNIHENEIEEDNNHESNKTSQLSKKRDETHDQYSDKITEDNEIILVEESNSEENLPSSDSTTEMSTQDSFSNLSNSKKEEKLEINKNLSGIEISLKQSLTKELMIKVENLNTSVEEQKESPSNKENQTLNIINDTLESNIHSSTNVISLSTKSPTPIFANKSSNEKETKFTKNESNLNKRRHSKESTEATMKQCILSKEIIDDIEEKMNISIDSSSSDLTCKQKCLDNLSVNDTIKRQSLVHEAECKSILSREEDVGSANEIIVKDKTPVKHISKSTDNIMEEITKSDKTEHTIMDTDSDVNKDSNNIELNKISCLSKNQNKTKEESDNKKSLSSVSIIGDNKMKLMLEEQSLYQNKNEASSNISHFNSDLTDLIVMSSVKNSNDQSNIMEKQPIQDNIIDNIDFTEQERRNSKHAIESVLESSNAALKTSNSEFNESNEDNAIIQDTQPSNVTETSGKFAINMPCEKAETKSNYKNTVKQESKRKSTDNIHLEKKKENLKLENQNDTNMNTDRDVIVDINVFHDITNDNSNKKNVEEELDIETNSVYSNLLKEPESESEVECDLVLVDKKAWLDAENMKTAKEAESFEYDSDDTVLLKSRLDAKTTDHEQIIAKKLPMISEDLLENRVDAKVGNCNKKSLIEEEKIDCNNKIINSISRMKKMIKNYKDSLSSTEDEDDLIAAVNKSINEFKTVSNQNNDRPVPKLNKSRQTFAKDGDRLFQIYDESDESIQSDDINELNKSLQVNKKNKSLSKSMERRKSLNKSSTKDMSSRQEAKATKNISINKSREDYSEKESDSTDAKKKTSKKKHSLNKSQNKDANTSESEEKNLSNAKTSTYLNDESDNDDNSEIVIPAMDFECRSYSTIAYMGSDPNEESNDDESKNSIGIPSFLFAANSDSNTDSSTDVNTSIHSDIKREYNLDGKEQKFSDDNVPGDECRASESEVSDPDDNGSDLEDFIVNDDEIEEEDNEDEIEEEDNEDDIEEEDNEDDDDDEEKERNSEEENEQNVEEAEYAKEEEVDNESEIKQSIREENKVMKKKEVKDKSYEQAYIDAENVKEKDERDDILDEGEDIEERLIKYIPLCFNTKMSSPEIKSPKIKRDIKKKKSDIMENKTILLDTSNLNSSIKNKSCMQKNEDIILLDTPNSSIKKKKKSNVQFSPKDVVEQLNKSEITSTRKLSKSRLSMECSTPKLDTYIRKYEEFNETLTPERILEIQDTKIDNTKTAQDTSLKKKKSKKNSILKEDISLREFNQIDNEKKLLNSSLPSDLAEAVKKAGLSKPKFSKMGELQKTINITHTESPTIRYLIKDKLNESMPALKLNTEIDSEKKKLSPIKKAKDIAQTKIELENDEKEIPNLITPSSDDTIQKRRKKQKKRKAQTEDISSENITDKVLSQDMMESDAPKKKKRVKLAHLSIIENDTCKDNQINEKETKQKKKQLSVIEQDKNVNEENVPQKNIRKNKTELAQRKKRNYEIVDSSEFDLSADIAVENKSKRQKIAESKEIVSEKLIKKKKREEKTSPLQIGISKLKSGKSLASNKLQNVGSDTINSKNAFAKARDEALEAIHAAEMRVRAKKELKKKKRENVENTIQEQILKIPDRKQRKKGVEKNDFLPSSTGRLKRLPDDVVENLTDLPTKAKKRQKLSRNQEQIMPLSHGSKSKATIAKADGFLTLSTSGSTTQFTVINMRKAKKESLKSGSAAVSFRQRMLDRNSRESVSAYKIYLEKQRATSKSRFFNNAF